MVPCTLSEVKVIYPTRVIGMSDKSYQPTIAGLRAFVAVAEKRQFSSAATTLGVSQSTLSQALAALETGLGTQLIERSTRRVFLTASGTELLPRAQAVIEAADAFSAAAAGSSDPLRAGIRLGLIPTVAPYVLPTILAGLAEELPELTVRVIEDQTERLLTVLKLFCGMIIFNPDCRRHMRRLARDVLGGREFKLGATLSVPARSPLILEISR